MIILKILFNEKIVIGDTSILFKTDESVIKIFFVPLNLPYLSTPSFTDFFLVIGIYAPRWLEEPIEFKKIFLISKEELFLLKFLISLLKFCDLNFLL